MPNIRSAKKKMRQDVKRESRNATYKRAIKDIMKESQSKKTEVTAEFVSKAYSLIDKAKKKRVIHAHKAARLKKGVSRLIAAKK